jgi:hypothetical protein
MRTASSLKKRHRAAAAGILLIVATLIVSGSACDGDGSGTYELAVSSASGGSITAPGVGTFVYDAGTVVQLAAMPDGGYEFRSWTGDITGIGDPNAASTTITMNGDYAIVANFQAEGGESPDGEVSDGEPPNGEGPYS